MIVRIMKAEICGSLPDSAEQTKRITQTSQTLGFQTNRAFVKIVLAL